MKTETKKTTYRSEVTYELTIEETIYEKSKTWEVDFDFTINNIDYTIKQFIKEISVEKIRKIEKGYHFKVVSIEIYQIRNI